MSQETSYVVVAIFAFVGIVGNIIAFLVARVELRAQRKETETLAILTSDLEHKVHRLATNLDYKIQRLERLRDLLTGLTQALTILRQGSQPQPSKLAAAIQIEMTKPELIAIVNASKDDILQKLGNAIVANFENDKLPIAWNEAHYNALPPTELEIFMVEMDGLRNRQYTLATQVHTRIIELIEDATNV